MSDSRIILRLERWRHGWLGTLLFYGYAVAIVITASLAVANFRGVHGATERIDRDSTRLAVQEERSCATISSAAHLWREIRAASVTRNNDPDRTAVQRAADERVQAALADVIARSDALTCKDRP